MADHMTAEQLRAEIIRHIGASRMIADSLDIGGQRVAAVHARSSIPFLEMIAACLECMAAAPDGWKLVPVNPTDAMQDEGAQAANAEHGRHNCSSIGYGHSEAVYRAMIAAAPEPPHV